MRRRRAAVLPVLATLALLAGCTAGEGGSTRTAEPAVRVPWFGALEPDGRHLQQDREAGMDVLVLSVSWADAEPTAGALSQDYLTRLRDRYRPMRAAGLRVILDPGLQYTPPWVFALSPDARFTDQYGAQWHGPPGEDTADAVHVSAVRDAQAAFVSRLSFELGRDAFFAVRVGGLLDGELRYPSPHYDGRTDSWWAYGTTAQAQTPVPGWRPGSGAAGAVGAAAFLEDYLDDLAAYQTWLLDRLGDAFNGQLQVLYPSWGVRPGEQDAAAARGLDGSTTGEDRQTLQLGVDWPRQLAALPGSPHAGRVVVYSTWLDAADQGSDPGRVSPIRWLAALAAGPRFPVAGENTGGDASDVAALERSVSRVTELHLVGLLWMTEADLYSGRGPTAGDYARLIGEARARQARPRSPAPAPVATAAPSPTGPAKSTQQEEWTTT